MLAIGHWILDLARKWSGVKIGVIASIGAVIGAIPVILLGASSAIFMVSIEVAVFLLALTLYARVKAHHIDSLAFLPSSLQVEPPQNITSDVPASSSERDDFMEYLSAKYVGKPDSPTPLVFPGTVIYTDESLLRLPVQRGGEIEPPPDAHVAIHQIGTAEPLGWFDSKGNWFEALPQADHSEMQYAPADWANEMAAIQVVFFKIDEQAETAQEQAQALYDAFAEQYGQYVTQVYPRLLREYFADTDRVGYHIRAYLEAPHHIVTQIKQEYEEAKPYQPWEGARWEQ